MRYAQDLDAQKPILDLTNQGVPIRMRVTDHITHVPLTSLHIEISDDLLVVYPILHPFFAS